MTDETPDCRLYLITPDKIDDVAAFAQTLDTVFIAGDVACLQLRLKDVEDAEILAAAKALMPVCVKHDVALIINDRADLAKIADVDGVHLGQNDGTVADAREMLGFDKIIGVTCHDSLHLAFEAGEAGANYVAFGAFFPTRTKVTTHQAAPDILTGWEEATEIPCVAIGGITLDNAKVLVDAGAHFLAVCSAVWDHPTGPAAAVKAFNDILGT